MANTPTPTSPSPQAPKPASAPGHKPEEDKDKPVELKPEAAEQIFRNGGRIAKIGEPKEKWITQARALDGVVVLQTPLTDEVLEEIRTGKYYNVE